jgi:hypothetical protein
VLLREGERAAKRRLWRGAILHERERERSFNVFFLKK